MKFSQNENLYCWKSTAICFLDVRGVLVKADNRLKKGTVKICVSVLEGTNRIISKVSEFNMLTLGK
ncbi:hypothetical protein [Prevotella sp. KH2C16]|uniref:hypothetical protein n=1 Tax=Prevotella sp. KH2C16 TaxID=1855325 RepID=UPI000B80BE1A|nr:hypothetical protein [Prevotella sp. KH2C16]